MHADEKLSAFVELERQVLTVTFYLESIRADSCRFVPVTNDVNRNQTTPVRCATDANRHRSPLPRFAGSAAYLPRPSLVRSYVRSKQQLEIRGEKFTKLPSLPSALPSWRPQFVPRIRQDTVRAPAGEE